VPSKHPPVLTLLSITLLNVMRGKKYTEGVLKVQATPRAGQNDRLPSDAFTIFQNGDSPFMSELFKQWF
jgi:hypothetical protein